MFIIDFQSKNLKGLFTYQAVHDFTKKMHDFTKKIVKVSLLQLRRQGFLRAGKAFANYYKNC